MEQTELASLVFLHARPGIGNRTLWKIKHEWGSFRACYESDHRSLSQSSLTAAVQAEIINGRQGLDMQAELELIRAQDLHICCVGDDDYPVLLRSIFDPPYLFYYRGNLELLRRFCVGVVGSRAATNYGKIQARRFGHDLAGRGIVVVSGLARGIDTEAHQGALEAGGATVAVLGSGLQVVYPPENKRLFDQIGAQGLIISEFPPQAHPEAGHFPVRNRTISGLCRGILVVEAKKRSGALITADFALEQGRDVFAIPGPINSANSAGTNGLIKQGACLVGSVEDILTEYGLDTQSELECSTQGQLSFAPDADQTTILRVLGDEIMHFDDILDMAGLNIGRLSAGLLQLELQGCLRALPGNYFARVSVPD